MIRPITVICWILALSAGLYLYRAKHEVELMDKHIEQIAKETNDIRAESRHLLDDWIRLGEPEQLHKYSDEYLGLKTIAPTQFARLSDLPSRLPPPQADPVPEPPAPVATATPDTRVATATPDTRVATATPDTRDATAAPPDTQAVTATDETEQADADDLPVPPIPPANLPSGHPAVDRGVAAWRDHSFAGEAGHPARRGRHRHGARNRAPMPSADEPRGAPSHDNRHQSPGRERPAPGSPGSRRSGLGGVRQQPRDAPPSQAQRAAADFGRGNRSLSSRRECRCSAADADRRPAAAAGQAGPRGVRPAGRAAGPPGDRPTATDQPAPVTAHRSANDAVEHGERIGQTRGTEPRREAQPSVGSKRKPRRRRTAAAATSRRRNTPAASAQAANPWRPIPTAASTRWPGLRWPIPRSAIPRWSIPAGRYPAANIRAAKPPAPIPAANTRPDVILLGQPRPVPCSGPRRARRRRCRCRRRSRSALIIRGRVPPRPTRPPTRMAIRRRPPIPTRLGAERAPR